MVRYSDSAPPGRIQAHGSVLFRTEVTGDRLQYAERRHSALRGDHGPARRPLLHPLGAPAGHAGTGHGRRDRRGLRGRRGWRGVYEAEHVERRSRRVRGVRRRGGRGDRFALPVSGGAGGDPTPQTLRRRGRSDRSRQPLVLRAGSEAQGGAGHEERHAPLVCPTRRGRFLKAYNDAHGHDAGDEILRGVARVIRESARADDLIGRYSGEEFVLLVNDDAEGALEVAERIRETVRRECVSATENPLERPITVSLGVISLSEETWSLERLVAMADAEMDRSKKTGKDRVSVFQSA